MSWRLYLGLTKSLHPNWKRKNLTKQKEKLLPMVSSLKVWRGVPNLLLAKVLNIKPVIWLHLGVSKTNLPKQVSVYLKTPPLYSPPMLRDTCILGSLPNIFPNVREANTHKLLSTFVSMPKLSKPRVMMFLTMRLCVNRRHRSPVTSGNSISGIVLPAIYVITSGGRPLSGANI